MAEQIYHWSKLSSEKWRDAWEERFHSLVDTCLVISEFIDKKKIRVDAYCKTREQADEIQRQFGGTIREIANRDWVAFSSPETPPILVRDRILITPIDDGPGLEALAAEHPSRKILSVPSQMAFGTGDHATTATCLRFLCDLLAEDQLSDGFACLDLGCGTGILAIAAAMLGAGETVAMDYDPDAIRIAGENCLRNGLASGRVSCMEGDVKCWDPPGQSSTFDLVFANIFADTLIETIPRVKEWVADSGHLILSGILEEYAEKVIEAVAGAGLFPREQRQRGKWVTIHLQHSGWGEAQL